MEGAFYMRGLTPDLSGVSVDTPLAALDISAPRKKIEDRIFALAAK
jgi:hypothetical protein